MFTKQRRNNVMYSLLALLFSLVLFFNANNSTIKGSFISANGYEETLTEVPVQITYDEDKYFIQGYQPTVTVELSSVNRIQLNAEVNEETRNFKVVADLSDLSEGTHDVTLEIEDLSNSVTATIDPTIFTVTIEKKVTKSFPVDILFSEENLQDGFQLDKIVAEPKTVTITTGDQTINEITKVVADLSSLENINSNLNEEVSVYATNENGDILHADIEPETVQVQATISAPQKEIGLYATQTGTLASNIAYYTIGLSQTYATIAGAQSLLDTLDSIEIPVDVSNVKEATERVVDIPVKDGLSVEPKQVIVTITPVFNETEATEETSTSSSETAESSTTKESQSSEESTTESSKSQSESATE